MQKEDFLKIKENMKARKITGTYIAFQTSRSASNINDILRGNYPYYQGYGLPKYLYDWLVSNKLLEPTEEGFLTRRAADVAYCACKHPWLIYLCNLAWCRLCGKPLRR